MFQMSRMSYMSHMLHMFHMSHISHMSQMCHMSYMPRMFHMSNFSHIFHMSLTCVSGYTGDNASPSRSFPEPFSPPLSHGIAPHAPTTRHYPTRDVAQTIRDSFISIAFHASRTG